MTARNKIKVTCEQCGKEIERSPSQLKGREHIFCSRKCQNQYHANKIKVPKIIKICDYCGKEYEVDSCKKQGKNSFCSHECHYNYMREFKPTRNIKPLELNCTCPECGKKFHLSKSELLRGERHFCSRTCASKYRMREKNKVFREDLNATCAYCGKKFHKKKSHLSDNLNFCCGEHRLLYHKERRIKLVCQECGKEFEVVPHKKDSAKYCSVECQILHQQRFFIHTKCAYCGKELYVSKERQNKNKTGLFFCDHECSNKYFRGENSPAFKGTRKVIEILRTYFGLYQRPKVFQRDNRICQICGAEAEHIHHIYPLHQIIKDFIKAHPDIDITENCYYVASLIIKESEVFKDLNNLIAVCKCCHKKIHSKSDKVSEKLDIT